MTTPPQKYDYTQYNHHNVLRLNWMYWGITLFLSRHLILLILLGVSAGRGGSGPRIPALAALLDPVFFVTDIPAVILLFVAGARLPKSGAVTRSLWHKGKSFLLASCALYVALLLWQQGADLFRFQPLTWGLLGINIGLMIFVVKSRYLRDLFSEFPAPDENSTA